jgi:hypothetical protein
MVDGQLDGKDSKVMNTGQVTWKNNPELAVF